MVVDPKRIHGASDQPDLPTTSGSDPEAAPQNPNSQSAVNQAKRLPDVKTIIIMASDLLYRMAPQASGLRSC